MDVRTGLAEQFLQRWPDIYLVQIDHPFYGLAARFPDSVYAPGEEELPE